MKLLICKSSSLCVNFVLNAISTFINYVRFTRNQTASYVLMVVEPEQVNVDLLEFHEDQGLED